MEGQTLLLVFYMIMAVKHSAFSTVTYCITLRYQAITTRMH